MGEKGEKIYKKMFLFVFWVFRDGPPQGVALCLGGPPPHRRAGVGGRGIYNSRTGITIKFQTPPAKTPRHTVRRQAA